MAGLTGPLRRSASLDTSTGHVIAGNHRLRVARSRGEATIPVLWLDVDDAQAEQALAGRQPHERLPPSTTTPPWSRLAAGTSRPTAPEVRRVGVEPDDTVRTINEMEGTGHRGPRPVDDGGSRAVVVLVPADRYAEFTTAARTGAPPPPARPPMPSWWRLQVMR